MPFSSPLSGHVHVVPANATCNGHCAVVVAKRPRMYPRYPRYLPFLSLFSSRLPPPAALCPIPIHGRHLDLHTTGAFPPFAKRDGLFSWRKRAFFCRGGLDCRWPRPSTSK